MARARVERLIVVVGSLAREPIPPERRLAWLRELRPDVTFVDLRDENPQLPNEHPEFWEIWTASLRRVVPEPIDLVFSSEDYGEELARRLDAQRGHVTVDRARAEVPVSGTAIRERPMENWAWIPAPVRPWFVKRVLVTGAESCGKTTLARALAARFGTSWAHEYAREHLDRRAPVAPGGPSAICELSDMEAIVRGHLALEEARAREAERVLFCDTDPGVTAVYSEIYFGEVPDAVARAARETRYDLALFCATDVPYEEDRQRELRARREEIAARIRAGVEARGIPVVELRGPHEARMADAERAIATIVALHPRP